jgi:hypothetical protein
MRRTTCAVVLAAVVAAVAGCGPSTKSDPAAGAGQAQQPTGHQPEINPVGDIPDDTAFVAFRPPSGRYEVKVPEGWARTGSGEAYTFTDKLNTVRIETLPAPAAPTVDSARADEVPAIQAGARRLSLTNVQVVRRKSGQAVLVTYRADSPVDPVTGKVVADAFERYEFHHAGTQAVLTLSGPVKADNVDPWRTVSDSFRWLG